MTDAVAPPSSATAVTPAVAPATLAPAAETTVGTIGGIEHRRVNWEEVRWTAYLIHQHFRYEYPSRIRDLRHRLVIVPPERHGDQRLVMHRVEVSSPTTEVIRQVDRHGNLVLTLLVDQVAKAIDFTAWIVVERDAEAGPILVAPDVHADPGLRGPSRLTTPDAALRAAAEELRREGGDPLALAGRINAWVHGRMAYADGSTGVRTTAAEALAQGRGVCQDYSHVMLALCRLCGLPARYVSGHLLGEGGTHAWVEVILKDPRRRGRYVAEPFDPTNGNRPGLNYVTVAVGRDYGDVAPTSGTYTGSGGSRLSTRKHASPTAVEYFARPA